MEMKRTREVIFCGERKNAFVDGSLDNGERRCEPRTFCSLRFVALLPASWAMDFSEISLVCQSTFHDCTFPLS